MKKQSIKINFIFQIIYQIIILVFPLITSPILTRTLGSSALGTYGYVISIAYYFLVFANLGISRHGQRLIAKDRDDDEKLRKDFWSLYVVHLIFSIIALMLYSAYIIIFVENDTEIYWLSMIYVASALFDITWLFYGLENFGSVVVKNLFIRIVTFLMVLILVKSPDDLSKYTLFECLTLLIGNVLLIPSAIKTIPFIKFSIRDCTQHIKPLFILSISIIATTLYSVFDKTLLGLMTTKENVAFYEYSNRIIAIPNAFIAVIGTVLFPRACKLASEGDLEGQQQFSIYAFYATALISSASIFGIISVSDLIAVQYYGENFAECGPVMASLTPIIFLVGFGNVVRNIFLIPLKKDTQFTIILCLASVANLILSIVLIPIIGIYGAVIGTIVAELLGMLLQIAVCRKQVNFKEMLKSIITFFIAGLIMYIVIKTIDSFMQPTITALLIEVLIGMIIYIILSILITFFFYREIWNKFINIFFKKFKK